MSTFKGNNVQHLNSSVPNVVLDASGNTTLRNLTATSIQSGSVSITNDLIVNGDTTIGNTSSDNLTVNATVTGSSFNAGIIGEIRMYSGSSVTPPSGWLYCNGSTIGDTGSGADHESDSYQTLFDLLKPNWGNANNEAWASGDTVKLPDFRGVFPIGVGQNQDNVKYSTDSSTLDQIGTDFTLSMKGGSEEHVLTGTQVENHNHTFTTNGSTANITQDASENYITDSGTTGISINNATPAITITDPGHTHQTLDPNSAIFKFGDPSNDSIFGGLEETKSSVYATSFTYAYNDQSYHKTVSSQTGISASQAAHSHTITDGGHTHTITQNDHTHTGSIIGANDVNEPHTNLPPYLAVNFIIKY